MPQFKKFEDVLIGDIATDYGDYTYPVIGKGSLKQMFEQFGNRCQVGIDDYLEDSPYTVDDNAIAVLTTDQPNGDVLIYFYDFDSALVLI